jgi:DNA-binding ferritin-like protein (Dps family)
MGGGSSRCDQQVHHYHTVYQTPPEVQSKLDTQTEALKHFEQEAKELGDPNLYKDNASKLLNNFIKEIPSLKLNDIIIKETGDNHIGFLGPISSGKTSMINAMFNKNLAIALGHCTDKCEVVVHLGKNKIWDVPGQNDDFKFYKPENLSFVKNLDKYLILFDNDIAMVSNILQVSYKINRNIIIVRTKVDQHSAQNARSIQEEKLLDRRKVKELLGEDIETYCVSSHNVSSHRDKYDWDIVVKKLGLLV